ncbi:MAG: GxxExxY protein [Sphingomonadaceae bacterium]|jgi:iron complex transport system substrate-binding protein
MVSHEGTKKSREDELERIARTVVDCGFHIHQDLGPGMLETAYEVILAAELQRNGLTVERQVPVRMEYKGLVVDNAFKIDLLVDRQLIVELKSIERLAPVHGKQVLTYLKLMDLPLGLLMNFGQALFKDGLRRIANDYYGRIGSR